MKILELADKDIKAYIIAVFCIFKKASRDMEAIKKINRTSGYENYNV